MDESRGKVLRDYQIPDEELKPFNLPRQPGTDDRYAPTQRHPGVGQVRGTTSSMGPKSVGGGGGVCGNLAISPEESPGTGFLNTAGSVGLITIAAGDAGGAVAGDSVYVKITLDGTDGTYTAELQTTEPTTSGTVIGRLIATISAEGVVVQNYCGPVEVAVCRDWYAAEAPYYTISFL